MKLSIAILNDDGVFITGESFEIEQAKLVLQTKEHGIVEYEIDSQRAMPVARCSTFAEDRMTKVIWYKGEKTDG